MELAWIFFICLFSVLEASYFITNSTRRTVTKHNFLGTEALCVDLDIVLNSIFRINSDNLTVSIIFTIKICIHAVYVHFLWIQWS